MRPRRLKQCGGFGVVIERATGGKVNVMQHGSTKGSDFNRFLGHAKKQAGVVAGAVADAAQDSLRASQ